MPAKPPLISVTMPAYNNQETIAEAIQSVLDQTFTDFELIVVNDGSTDRTEEIVRQFNDPRIVYHSQTNQGGSQATNRAIELARGRYIALFAADDVCYPERLARQYRFLAETGQKIVFAWADFIDDTGQPIDGPHFALNFFNHPPRTRAEMLNWFFFKGNYLCTVTGMAERQLFIEAGLFRPSAAQVPDLWMWGKLVKSVELAMLPERMVKYRIRAGEGNVSGPHNAARAHFEIIEFNRHLLDGLPVELFREAFARHLKNPAFRDGTEYELEKAFLYLQHNFAEVRQLGVEKLSNLFVDLNVVEVAREKYGFGLPELFLLSKSVQISASLETVQLKFSLTNLEQSYLEAKKYATSLERENQKLEEYARSLERAYDEAQQYLNSLEPAYRRASLDLQNLEIAYREAQQYLQSLEPAYREAQQYLQSLEPAYRQLLDRLESERLKASATLEESRLANQALQASHTELTGRLDRTLTANQELQIALARYEQDLRQLQATRTVRLSRLLPKFLKKP